MIASSELLPGFESVLDRDEKVLWIERPRFVPFLAASFGFLGLVIIVIVAIRIFISRSGQLENNSTQGWGLWIELAVISFFACGFVKRLLSFRNISYAYSNRRVMIRSGITGSNFKVIEFDKIIEVEVTMNFMERYHKVGTVKFFSGNTETDEGNTSKVYDSWEAIPDPHTVFKQVKEAMAAIKSKT